MATFRQADDGHYYTVAFAGDNISPTTYQINLEGVAFLKQHRVKIGQKIPPNILAELKRKRWMYTFGSGPGLGGGFIPEPPEPTLPSPIPNELEQAITYLGLPGVTYQQEGFRLASIVFEMVLPAELALLKRLAVLIQKVCAHPKCYNSLAATAINKIISHTNQVYPAKPVSELSNLYFWLKIQPVVRSGGSFGNYANKDWFIVLAVLLDDIELSQKYFFQLLKETPLNEWQDLFTRLAHSFTSPSRANYFAFYFIRQAVPTFSSDRELNSLIDALDCMLQIFYRKLCLDYSFLYYYQYELMMEGRKAAPANLIYAKIVAMRNPFLLDRAKRLASHSQIKV